MDVVTIARIAFRRWYVILPILIATLVAVAAVRSTAEEEYRSKAVIIVVGPSEGLIGEQVTAVNPFAYFGDSLKVLTLAAARVMDGSQVREEIASQGFTADYTLSVQPGTTFLEVQATGPDTAEVNRTIEHVLQVIDAKILELQTDTPPIQRYGTKRLLEPVQTSSRPAASPRQLGIIGGLGILAALGLALGVDAASRRRSRRAEAAAAEERAAAGGPGPGGAAGTTAGAVTTRPVVPATPAAGVPSAPADGAERDVRAGPVHR